MLLIGFLVLVTIYMAAIGLSIHSSERQIITHYSAFGITHFYFNQWFYLISFVLFGVVMAIINTVISIKLLLVKGRSLAVAFAWISIGIVLFSWSTASTILALGELL